ncbi:bifunctional acyl-ACP--phospholipid O-acyltransferase/long-chain-fatty-acid--ACP ligase [Leeia sp. TBRC 13508]|uniref:Bifunctional acyl-ACP--phospholipid O-acyltransferase/long-chain-fatty-acid--ACP ligase n=1 Tax=Leeia speluncae TaxID=2884804 RepID=A0ABS8D1B9_9NEIS|nr:bifunctional acyl-ACP--phospholipid O-acyltransferase/long-chain-fatty-acid--ACP ligase [Leeia speluncae]MCB6181995.1 bifunctional acyl-ACP--phospholipid O-acyltransferase/long-chain-fatty-acid--ACP ligase [Leeia speluncae]
MKSWMQTLLRPLLKFFFKVFFRVQIRGHQHLFNHDRLLIIANHQSFLDGLLIGLFLPIKPIFVVNTAISKQPLFKVLLSMVDYLAVDPTQPMAMKKIVKLVESGQPIVIFPEGRITITGNLMKVYEGPAFVAAKTGATLCPIQITGASHSYFSRLPGTHPKSLFPQLSLTFLPPTELPMPDAPSAKLRRRKAGEEMRKLMQHLNFVAQPITTLYESLLSASALYGRKRKLVEDIKQIEYSYGDLQKMTLMLGRLSNKFTAPSERVGLLLPNLAPTAGLLIGLTANGRVPAMLNFTAGTDGIQSACTAATIRTIITSRAFVEQAKLDKVIHGLKDIQIRYLEDLRALLTLKDKLWWIGFARWCPAKAVPKQASDNIAVVLFTSGSEGKPKGVALSHRAILSNIAQIRSIVDFSVTDKVLNALPIFHSFGLTAGTLLPIFAGVGLFLYPSPLHYRVIPEVAYDRSCTILFGTSTFLGNYARFAHPYDFFRMRFVVAGAEKLSQAVKETWFEKFGIRIFEGYGATETAPVIAVNTPMAFRSGSVGQLLPGLAHKLVPVPGIDSGGILHVKGPNVMSGYYKFEKPGELQPALSEVGEGWYDTGDVVALDEDGFVKITGRVKRFAKIAGEMVSLEVVEKLAVQTSPDKLHAASSQPDAAKGEALVLFTTDPSLTRERLLQTAQQQGLPELSVPRKIRLLEAIPLLGTGKTDYVTLKQMALTA